MKENPTQGNTSRNGAELLENIDHYDHYFAETIWIGTSDIGVAIPADTAFKLQGSDGEKVTISIGPVSIYIPVENFKKFILSS